MGVDEAVEKQQQGTVWKFKEFSVIHILREINFCEFEAHKNANAILIILLAGETGKM